MDESSTRAKLNPEMANKVAVKTNGEVTTKKVTKQLKEDLKTKNFNHLCGKDCACAYANVCPKIAHLPKKDISEYEFISDGMQVYDSEGYMSDFIVSGCSNYKYKDPFENKKMDLRDLKRIRESLKIYYFDAESIEEAEKIEYELAKRGALEKGYPVDKEKYKELSRKYSKWY